MIYDDLWFYDDLCLHDNLWFYGNFGFRIWSMIPWWFCDDSMMIYDDLWTIVDLATRFFFSSRFMGKMKFSAFFNHGMEVRSDSNTQPKSRETSHHQMPHHHPWFSQKFPKVPPTFPWFSQPIIISSLKGEVDGDDMMVSLGAASNIGGLTRKSSLNAPSSLNPK